MLRKSELEHIEEILRQAAEQELRPRFLEVETYLKADGSVLTEADLGMQARVLHELESRWPAFTLLGEEMEAGAQEALLQDRSAGLWVLDPLDGTSNFASGIPYFGVSLALIDAEGVQLGLVLDPVRGECFSALRGQGAWLNGQPLLVKPRKSSLSGSMAMVDFKRLPAGLAQQLASGAPYRSQRSFGSVALDWCWLAAGRVQLYLHGGARLWDYAAGSLIFAEAGGTGGLYQDYRGTSQQGFTLQPRIGLAAVGADLFEKWHAWIRARADSPPTG